MIIPDTVEELLEYIDEEPGANALFWALTDEGDIVACEAFKIWKGEGDVFAEVIAEGLATKYRVVCEVTDLDYSAEWDDKTPINVAPGDGIRFHFTLRTFTR